MGSKDKGQAADLGLGLAVAYVRASSAGPLEQAAWLRDNVSVLRGQEERAAFLLALGNLPVLLGRMLADVMTRVGQPTTVDDLLGVMVQGLARSEAIRSHMDSGCPHGTTEPFCGECYGDDI